MQGGPILRSVAVSTISTRPQRPLDEQVRRVVNGLVIDLGRNAGGGSGDRPRAKRRPAERCIGRRDAVEDGSGEAAALAAGVPPGRRHSHRWHRVAAVGRRRGARPRQQQLRAAARFECEPGPCPMMCHRLLIPSPTQAIVLCGHSVYFTGCQQPSVKPNCSMTFMRSI